MMGAMSDLPPTIPPNEPGFPAESPARLPGRTPPDLGTPTSRVVALVVVGVLYGLLALAQNLAPYLMPREGQVGRKPRGGEVAKLLLLFEEAFRRGGLPSTGQFPSVAAGQFASSDLHPADQLQSVLVLGESESPEAALEWLGAIRSGEDLEKRLERRVLGEPTEEGPEKPATDAWAEVEGEDGPTVDPDAVADAETMEALYGSGLGSLTTEQVARLRERYGWLGELATAVPDSAERAALYDDIPWAVALIVLVMAVFFVAGLGGLTMFIIAAVMFFGRRLPRRFVPPAPGGSVFLETFGVFLAGFGLVHFGVGVLSGSIKDERTLLLITLAAQWVLVLTIFWPRLRGVDGRGWREAIGWYAPRGVWREVLAGVAGYFAGLPLLLAAMVFTVVLNMVVQALSSGPIEPPQNPMVELVANGDALVIVLFLSLATVWAPIVEESLFRGAVYRHLRARFGAFVCAVLTALLFAFMHSYGPLLVGPLIALGFTFAMIREWRGSVIGAATAHCLHNSTIMVLMLVGLKAMG